MLDDCAGRRLELDRSIAIAIDICRALEHAHSRGIVHRDLKPANIWLGDDDTARLGDFGLASTDRRSRAAVEGMLVGTVAYLPPEQALGRSADARSDLYSLGAMLYELLTGEPPFQGEDAVGIIGQHLNAEPVALRATAPRFPPRSTGSCSSCSPSVLRIARRARPRRGERSSRSICPPSTTQSAGAEANPLESLAGGVFVGRDAELDQMRTMLEGALGSQGSSCSSPATLGSARPGRPSSWRPTRRSVVRACIGDAVTKARGRRLTGPGRRRSARM